MIPLPPNTVDETGHVYGALEVLEYAGREETAGHARWLCQCSCGEPACKGRVTVRGKLLRAGGQVSCGALRGNPELRRAARLKVPPKRRLAIARMGAAARRRAKKPAPPKQSGR